MMIRAVDPLQHTSMYQRAEEGCLYLIQFIEIWVDFAKPMINLIYPKISIDSEDSDGEGGLGNVSRVIIRPPGHSGKGNNK